MSDQSKILEQAKLPPTGACTSLPGLESGTTPSALPDGPPIGPSGRRRARANRSAQPAAGVEPKMTATFGPGLFDSSPSDVLTWSLESRYRRLTASAGSMLYDVIWRPRATPAGHWIPAQRGSARLTCVNVSTGVDCELMGWPTMQARDWKGAQGRSYKGKAFDLPATVRLAGWPATQAQDCKQNGERPNSSAFMLIQAALLTGWGTPNARDHFPAHSEGYIAGKKADGHGMQNLNDQVQLSGWATPNVPNGGRISGNAEDIGKKRDGTKAQIGLENQAKLTATGPGQTGCLLGPNGWETFQACGQLNPAHSRWLMGLPPAWDVCGATAMPSSRSRRRRSSGA